jgi:septal ring-binding cell division protein DamX
MVPGMVGSVNYGSGKKAYDPLQTVAGKTGTCIGQGSWLGLFTSYAPLANPRLAVVVIGRGSDARNHFPAAVAGKIYRDLGSRFGAAINLQVATSKPTNDSKSEQLNEEDKDEAEAEAAETEAATSAEEAGTETTATTQPEASRPAANQTPAPRDTVKRVLMPIEPRPNQIQRPETKSMPTKTAGKAPTQPDDRPRKTQP